MLFFFNDTATTEIYTLSLHDALPISHGPALLFRGHAGVRERRAQPAGGARAGHRHPARDRQSTRLNSAPGQPPITASCLKKNKVHLFKSIKYSSDTELAAQVAVAHV